MDSVFASQLEWALPRGLILNNNIQRKCVDGLYGMYATSDLGANELLASFPEENLLKVDKKSSKLEGEQFWLSWVKSAAKEYKKQNSDYKGVFLGFEALDEMRTYSSYFCDEDELRTIQNMSPVLHRWVTNANAKADEVVTALQKEDPRLDREIILTIYLNIRSRGFNPQGVVPVLDQFNHSDIHGQGSVSEAGRIALYTKRPYKAGEQIFISYGPKDLYKHAIHYNYFDPAGTHLIEFGRKSIQSAEGEVGKKLHGHLRKHFKIKTFESEEHQYFLIADDSVILTEYGLTNGLIKFLKEACRCRLPKNVTEQELMKHAAQYFVYLADQQIRMNRVEAISKELITPRLERFYNLLVKERQILLLNMRKVTG